MQQYLIERYLYTEIERFHCTLFLNEVIWFCEPSVASFNNIQHDLTRFNNAVIKQPGLTNDNE